MSYLSKYAGDIAVDANVGFDGYQTPVACGKNDTDVGIVYCASVAGSRRKINFSRVSSAGALTLNPVAVVTTDPGFVVATARILWNGSEYAMVWRDSRNGGSYAIYFERFNKQGGVVGIGPTQVLGQVGSDYDNPSIAFGGLLVGSTYAYYGIVGGAAGSVYFTGPDPNGLPNTPTILVDSVNKANTSQAIAWNDLDREFGLTWWDTVQNRVYFRRLDGYGTAVGGIVTVSTTSGAGKTPVIAFGDTSYGVAYFSPTGNALIVAIISRTGTIVNYNSLAVMADTSQPLDIRWDHSHQCFVVSYTASQRIAVALVFAPSCVFDAMSLSSIGGPSAKGASVEIFPTDSTKIISAWATDESPSEVMDAVALDSAPLSLTIESVAAVQDIIVDVVFSAIPLAESRIGLTDALNPSNWTIVDDLGAARQISSIAINSPAPGGRVVGTTQGNKAISITVVGPLESDRVYTLTASASIQDATKTFSLSGQLAWSFPGLHVSATLTIQDSRIGADLFYDPFLADIASTPSGDWSTQKGAEEVKKKIIRRLSTRKGGFYHAPNFGIDLPSKKLMTRSRILRAQKDVRRQVMNEPGVLSAQATITTDPSGSASVLVKAKVVGDTTIIVGPLGIMEA